LLPVKPVRRHASKLFNKAKNAVWKSKGWLTKKNGFIDYSEIHSFGIGFIDGFLTPGADHFDRLEEAKDLYDDVADEPHYFTQGYSLGATAFRITGVVLLVLFALSLTWITKSP